MLADGGGHAREIHLDGAGAAPYKYAFCGRAALCTHAAMDRCRRRSTGAWYQARRAVIPVDISDEAFEYMAAGRPIIASATPAIKDAVSEDEALLYEPDNAKDLADKARRAVVGGTGIAELASRATQAVQRLSWNERAKRVIHFIESTLNESISR